MNIRKITFLSMALCFVASGHAQNLNSGKAKGLLDDFVSEAREDFDNFRRETMEEFTDFVRNPWKEFGETKPVPKPKDEPVPPVVLDPKEDPKPIKSKPIVIKKVIKPAPPKPQPKPVKPIKEVPVVKTSYLDFTFFGTPEKVRFEKTTLPHLSGVSEVAVSDALKILSKDINDNMIVDCLKIRKDRKLSDWAYLKMLETIAGKIYPDSRNDAQLLVAYLMMQSGYKMRFAMSGNDLYALYATEHTVFDRNSFYLDGYHYYSLSDLPQRLNICQASFPGEKPLSLRINSNQDFAKNLSDNRTISSKRYEDMKVDVVANKNLIDFYNTYPSSCVDGNFLTRWALYADTPLDPVTREKLYPQMKEKLAGKTQLEAANMLLNWIQTGLVYEYDDKVWGGDRAFFAEESLYYPYADCEDRSVLLTRMVRDLLGLDCILIYYPGHLASAINFNEGEVAGDYIELDGKRYVIADATYINAPVGRTMRGMDNSTADVIKCGR